MSRVKLWTGLIVLFSAGALSGIAGMYFYHNYEWEHRGERGPAAQHERIMERLFASFADSYPASRYWTHRDADPCIEKSWNCGLRTKRKSMTFYLVEYPISKKDCPRRSRPNWMSYMYGNNNVGRSRASTSTGQESICHG